MPEEPSGVPAERTTNIFKEAIVDANYWHQKWERTDIAFHKSEANPMLVKYLGELSPSRNSRLFLPLCGKTLDIGWLLSNDYSVAGAELSEIAVQQLFAELGVEATVSEVNGMHRYSARNIDIFVGDIFDLSAGMLGEVDAVYDRAALVAMPEHVRPRYAAHLVEITGKAPQLLVCYEYDQRLMDGPPFSVGQEEVKQHYGNSYDLKLIASIDVPGGLKGHSAVKESVWLLRSD